MTTTKLSDYKAFDAKRLIFSNPDTGNIPGSMNKLTFKRIKIAVKNEDGSIGDVVIATPPNLLCYGLQEQTDPSTGAVNGYQFPLVLWNNNHPSDDEKTFTNTIHSICDTCKDHLIANKDAIEKYDLEMNDLKKFNPLYYKMDRGRIIEDKSPVLYAKTLSSKKDGDIKVYTLFTNEENEMVNPLDLMNKRCYVQGALKIESIFIGNKISLQMKLLEARVKVIDTSFRSLLNPSVVIHKEPTTPEKSASTTTKPFITPEPQSGFTETGSLIDEDEDEN